LDIPAYLLSGVANVGDYLVKVLVLTVNDRNVILALNRTCDDIQRQSVVGHFEFDAFSFLHPHDVALRIIARLALPIRSSIDGTVNREHIATHD
jgi:hypothetical protein